MTNLDLSDETAVGRNAVSAILNIMQSIFPRDLEVLHDKHDHEGRGGRDSTCNACQWGERTCISCSMTTRIEPGAVRGLNENEDAAFIVRRLTPTGGSERVRGMWDHTPLQ